MSIEKSISELLADRRKFYEQRFLQERDTGRIDYHSIIDDVQKILFSIDPALYVEEGDESQSDGSGAYVALHVKQLGVPGDIIVLQLTSRLAQEGEVQFGRPAFTREDLESRLLLALAKVRENI